MRERRNRDRQTERQRKRQRETERQIKRYRVSGRERERAIFKQFKHIVLNSIIVYHKLDRYRIFYESNSKIV